MAWFGRVSARRRRMSLSSRNGMTIRFRKVLAGPYLFKAQGPRVVENFLDVGHFPFVHAGFLGDPGHTEVGDYEVVSTADGIEARDIAVWQPDPDGTGQSAEVKYTYRVLRPLTAYFLKSHRTRGFPSSVAVDARGRARKHRLDDSWRSTTLRKLPTNNCEISRTWSASQDIPIVESQRPELLPLDLAGGIAFAFGPHGDRLPAVAHKNRIEVRYRVSTILIAPDSAPPQPARWFVPGDLDGFFGLFFSGFPDLILIASFAPLCGLPHGTGVHANPARGGDLDSQREPFLRLASAPFGGKNRPRRTSPRFRSASIRRRFSRTCS